MERDDSAIKPGEPGWRDRYYESKFGAEFARDKETFKTVRGAKHNVDVASATRSSGRTHITKRYFALS